MFRSSSIYPPTWGAKSRQLNTYMACNKGIQTDTIPSNNHATNINIKINKELNTNIHITKCNILCMAEVTSKNNKWELSWQKNVSH